MKYNQTTTNEDRRSTAVGLCAETILELTEESASMRENDGETEWNEHNEFFINEDEKKPPAICREREESAEIVPRKEAPSCKSVENVARLNTEPQRDPPAICEEMGGIAKLGSTNEANIRHSFESDKCGIDKHEKSLEESILDQIEKNSSRAQPNPLAPTSRRNHESASIASHPGAYVIRNSAIYAGRTLRRGRNRWSQGTSISASIVSDRTSVQTAIAAEIAPDQEELISNYEEAKSEREILQRKLEEIEQQSKSVVTGAIILDSDASSNCRMNKFLGYIFLVTLVMVGIVIAIVLGIRLNSVPVDEMNQSSDRGEIIGSAWNGTTFQYVKYKRKLTCRAESIEVAQGFGFSLDLCRAISAAVFGDADLVEYPLVPFSEQWQSLYDRTLDLSTTQSSFNMVRDVYQTFAGKAFSFSTPYFYTGTTFAGIPEMIGCVDRKDTVIGVCRNLKVCVLEDAATKQLVDNLLSGTVIIPNHDSSALFESFVSGACNVIAGSPLHIFEQRVRDINYTGPYELSETLFSNEPLAMVSRGDDAEWAGFVNLVLNALITAEAMNITQENADEFPTTNLFGGDYKNMFRNSIAAVGNYGEMYARHYEIRVPRETGRNRINDGTSGILYPFPFGHVNDVFSLLGTEPEIHAGGKLEQIKSRGQLRCGIIGNRTGFAIYDDFSKQWSGIDVDFCYAVTSTIFPGGDPREAVLFLDHATTTDGYVSLSTDAIDILAGGIVSIEAQVHEPTTQEGFAFSPPYFYGNDSTFLALVSRQHDSQWADFIRWIVHAAIYAEFHGITRDNVQEMPVVEVFGIQYRQMFRDIIVAVGNYGEIYERNLQSFIPRIGRNLLNVDSGPQLLPLPF